MSRSSSGGVVRQVRISAAGLARMRVKGRSLAMTNEPGRSIDVEKVREWLNKLFILAGLEGTEIPKTVSDPAEFSARVDQVMQIVTDRLSKEELDQAGQSNVMPNEVVSEFAGHRGGKVRNLDLTKHMPGSVVRDRALRSVGLKRGS